MVKATSSCRVPVGLVSTSQDSHALPFNAKGWVVNGARSRATSGLSGGERNGPFVTVTRMASSDDLLQPTIEGHRTDVHQTRTLRTILILIVGFQFFSYSSLLAAFRSSR